MLTFQEFAQTKGIDMTPDGGTVDSPGYSGDWFTARHLPMVIACSGCEMTMCIMSPTVRIDPDGKIWCKNCANVSDTTPN